MTPQGGAKLARRIPTVGNVQLAMPPGLFVAQDSREFGPAGIGDGLGQAVVGQHPGHVQAFDDEPVVGLDQLVRHLVEEMAAHIGDVMVVTP